MQEMGTWLAKYGETIYGTRGGVIEPHEWGVSTQKGNKLYIHILNLQDSSLFIPLKAKIKKARLFDGGKPVSFTKSGSGYTLNLPVVPKDIDYIVELTL